MSKNVTVNGVDYTGVSQVQLPTTAGGTALFKDVDEITEGGVSIWEGYQHTMQVAPIPYIIDKCENATAKGTFTFDANSATKDTTTELFDTGLLSVHFLVIMLKNPVAFNNTQNGYPIRLVLVDVDNQYSSYFTYSTSNSANSGGGNKAVNEDGTYYVNNFVTVSFDGGKVNVKHIYNGEQYSAFRSTNEYLWFAW